MRAERMYEMILAKGSAGATDEEGGPLGMRKQLQACSW